MGLPDVLGLRGHCQLALGEAQTQRGVSLRKNAGAPDDLEERLAGGRDLGLEGLREKLLVVRELAVDPAAREPDVAGVEDDVVLVDAELNLAGAACQARELLQRSGGNDRVELRSCLLELRLLHREAVGVRRRHDQLVAFEADEDPGQHRPRLVAGSRARDFLDGREKRRRGDRVELDVGRRQPRKVLGAVDVQT